MVTALNNKPTVLVIDDEESMREGCRQTLDEGGYQAEVAEDGLRGLKLVEQIRPDMVLIDLKMPGMSGMELLGKIREIDPNIVPVIITGYGTTESAIEAMKLGASDYLSKPFDDTQLLETVRFGIQSRSSRTAPRAEMIEATQPEKRFLSPAEVAREVVEISKSKCKLPALQLAVLGMLAGVYIGFGAELCTMVVHDVAKYLGLGLAKFIGGSVFSVGLMLVILAGAELFTGNCLIFAGVIHRQCSVKGMLRNWGIVYAANFVGSLLLAGLMYKTGLWRGGDFAVGAAALRTAMGKVSLSVSEAFFRGVGCNWLVCLAVWLAIAGRDTISKIFGIYFPIMAFVASGFEHSVANMYFIPTGLFLKSSPEVVNASGLGHEIHELTWSRFLVDNLVPVTLGNIVGGALFVAGAYYVVYLLKSR